MISREDIQHYRNTERRHMIAAKNALQNGLEQLDDGGSVDVDFVLACVQYLDYIIGRFVEQGRGNTSRLREFVPADDAADQRILGDIESTLALTTDQLAALRLATARFREGLAEIEKFRGACDEFLNFYNSVLAQRKDPAKSIIQKYIDPDTYWARTNDVTPESIKTEQALFVTIRKRAPDGFQIDE